MLDTEGGGDAIASDMQIFLKFQHLKKVPI